MQIRARCRPLLLCFAVVLGMSLSAARAPGEEQTSVLREASTLVYLDVASIDAGVSQDSEFFQHWKREVLSFVTFGAGIDVSAASAAWVMYEDGVVLVFEFPAPLDRAATLACFGDHPTRLGDDDESLYRFPDSQTLVLLRGDRTLLISGSETAIARFRHAAERDISPRRLVAERGGNTAAQAFLSARRPFPPEVRQIIEHNVTGRGDEAAARLLAGLEEVRFRLCVLDDVPLRLSYRMSSRETAELLERRTAEQLAELQREYDETGRAELLADDSVPDTARLIGAIDRLVRGARVLRSGQTVELQVDSPGGLPAFFAVCLHEFARASRQAVHTFDRVSDELNQPGDFRRAE
jgi:hypothetical protein